MSVIKKLAGQTAVYGLSSILGRLLNYLLVPIYTRVFNAGEYGVVTEMYAYVSFLTIVFTYGLETAFFRYAEKEKSQNIGTKIYSTSLISIIASSFALAVLFILFSSPIADAINKGEHSQAMLPKYISWFACILAFEAVSAIPFAKLRQENRPLRFASIKLIWILVNVGLNIFFIVLCPKLMNGSLHDIISKIYDPAIGVGYVFISNLIASALVLLLLFPEIFSIKYKFDSVLWKSMLIYSLPLMIGGFAGMINETFDRILLPRLMVDKTTALAQLGIYGACYKLSILMTLFIQTFRYAAEPFFFSHASKENAKEVYAKVMHYFVIVCAFIFLGIMMYIDIVKYFIGEEFREGLKVVPVLLMANLCLGVFFNLSIWYKISGQTKWGAWLAIFGAVITLVFNFWLIPIMGYMGAAWTTLICYASMMFVSYGIGQRYYRVNYNLRSFTFYIVLSLVLFFISNYLREHFQLTKNIVLVINSGFMIVFLLSAFLFERNRISYLRALNKKID